jgi:hypothetical protein
MTALGATSLHRTTFVFRGIALPCIEAPPHGVAVMLAAWALLIVANMITAVTGVFIFRSSGRIGLKQHP